MVRQLHLIAVVSTLLMAVLVVGCAAFDPRINDGRGGKRSAVASQEETTASEGDRSKTQTAQEPIGLDAKVVSPPDQGNLPAGFGEGSLWAIGSITATPPSASASASASPPGAAGTGGGPGGPPKTLFVGLDSQTDEELATSGGGPVAPKAVLWRLDPQTGQVVATIPLEDLNNTFTQVAFGAGSVWVSSGYYEMGPAPKRSPGDVVFRIDPQTNRVVDRIAVDPPSGLAFGHGSVWATSAGYGTVSRIDPQTDEVVAKIKVGRGAFDIAADESSGAVWVASGYLPKTYGGYDYPKYSEDNNVTRVDPATNRVVEEIPIDAHSQYGANNVAVGEGAVWVLSDGKLLKVDPATNEITATVTVGDSPSQLAVYGGGVWALVQAKEYRLVRVDPQTMHVVASEDIGLIPKIGEGALAAGGGYVWFWSEEGLARVSP